MDDIEGMDEAALLKELRVGALRMLARNMREGQLTHQELAIARGLLRDNNKALKPVTPEEDFEEEDDPDLPPPSRTKLPERRPRPDYDGTEG